MHAQAQRLLCMDPAPCGMSSIQAAIACVQCLLLSRPNLTFDKIVLSTATHAEAVRSGPRPFHHQGTSEAGTAAAAAAARIPACNGGTDGCAAATATAATTAAGPAWVCGGTTRHIPAQHASGQHVHNEQCGPCNCCMGWTTWDEHAICTGCCQHGLECNAHGRIQHAWCSRVISEPRYIGCGTACVHGHVSGQWQCSSFWHGAEPAEQQLSELTGATWPQPLLYLSTGRRERAAAQRKYATQLKHPRRGWQWGGWGHSWC